MKCARREATNEMCEQELQISSKGGRVEGVAVQPLAEVLKGR